MCIILMSFLRCDHAFMCGASEKKKKNKRWKWNMWNEMYVFIMCCALLWLFWFGQFYRQSSASGWRTFGFYLSLVWSNNCFSLKQFSKQNKLLWCAIYRRTSYKVSSKYCFFFFVLFLEWDSTLNAINILKLKLRIGFANQICVVDSDFMWPKK